MHNHVFEKHDESALCRANREKEIHHADDALVPAVNENPAAAWLLENETETAFLLAAVGHEVAFDAEQIVKEVYHLGQILDRRLLDDRFVHLRHAAVFAEGSDARKAVIMNLQSGTFGSDYVTRTGGTGTAELDGGRFVLWPPGLA